MGGREANFYIIFAKRVTKLTNVFFSDQLESVLITSQRQFSREILFSFCAIAPKLHYSRKSMQREKKAEIRNGMIIDPICEVASCIIDEQTGYNTGPLEPGGQIMPTTILLHPPPPRISKPSYDPVIELTIV